MDGHILAIGGFVGNRVFDVVESRSVMGKGTWHDVSPLPLPRTNAAAATVDGVVYVVGGIGKTGHAVDRVEVFNTKTGRWASGPPLPQPRAAAAAAALDGRLYVAGGVGDGEITNSVVAYNSTTNDWRQVAPMPTARWRLRLVALGGYLYAIAGVDDLGESLTTVERYDPRSDSWRTMNALHESRAVPCAVETRVGTRRVIVVVGGAVFSAGGTLTGDRDTTEVFDPDSGRWKLLNVLLRTPRGSNVCATEADGTVLTIGGATVVDHASRTVYLADVDALSLKPRDLL